MQEANMWMSWCYSSSREGTDILRLHCLLSPISNKLRQTRTAALDTQDSEGNENVFLGFEGKDFSFQDLENEVEFLECSAENKDIESIKDWIASVSS